MPLREHRSKHGHFQIPTKHVELSGVSLETRLIRLPNGSAS